MFLRGQGRARQDARVLSLSWGLARVNVDTWHRHCTQQVACVSLHFRIQGSGESCNRDSIWVLVVNWHKRSRGRLSRLSYCEFPTYLVSSSTLSFSTLWVGLISACCSRTGRWVLMTGSWLMLLMAKCWRNLKTQRQCYYVTILAFPEGAYSHEKVFT